MDAVMLPDLMPALPELILALGAMALLMLGVFRKDDSSQLVSGIALGLLVRLVVSSMSTAGNTIAFQMGLGFALNVDPSQGVQGALIGNFMALVGMALIFASDLHHLAIGGLLDSFAVYPPGVLMPFGDMAEMATRLVGDSFKVAIQISAPFIVFGLIFYLGLGLLSRLMPQLQIFIIAMPLNIIGGFVLLGVLLASLMTLYLDHVARYFGLLLVN